MKGRKIKEDEEVVGVTSSKRMTLQEEQPARQLVEQRSTATA